MRFIPSLLRRPVLTVPVLAAVLGGLGACSSILPDRGPAPALYQLSPAESDVKAVSPLAAQLVVEEPLASRGIDTDRIVLRPRANEVTYLAAARWSDRAPRLVQSLLVEAIERTGGFTGVGRPADGLRADFALVSEVRAFEADMSGSGDPKINVIVAAKILKVPAGRVVSSKLLSRTVEARNSGKANIIAAFDEAAQGVASDAAAWALAEITPPEPAKTATSALPLAP